MCDSSSPRSGIDRRVWFAAAVGVLTAAAIWLCLRLIFPPAPVAVGAPPGSSAEPVAQPAAIKPQPAARVSRLTQLPQPLPTPTTSRFPKTPFHRAFCAALQQRGINPESVCDPTNPAEIRILAEYGAIFVADAAARLPPHCIFSDEAAVTLFQREAQATSAIIGRSPVVLQPAALAAFQAACTEAKEIRLSISVTGGAKASRRSLADTEEVWKRYVDEALRNWKKRGRLDRDQVIRLRKLPPHRQAEEILELEARGLYFGLAQRKSIMSSAAVPGASQHLSLLALDITQYANPEVRKILAKHGWYQTVLDDFPHFTWLGVPEEELSSLGLHSVISSRQTFWVPEIRDEGGDL